MYAHTPQIWAGETVGIFDAGPVAQWIYKPVEKQFPVSAGQAASGVMHFRLKNKSDGVFSKLGTGILTLKDD